MTAIDKMIVDAISYYVDERCRTVAEPVEGGKMRMSSKAFDMAEERGKTKGMMEKAVETVRNLVRDFDFSVEQACNAANISVDDYKKNNGK